MLQIWIKMAVAIVTVMLLANCYCISVASIMQALHA